MGNSAQADGEPLPTGSSKLGEKCALKSADRFLDALKRNRQREANVTGASKACAGHGQYALLCEPFGKRNVVRDGRSEEDVECAFRSRDIVADGLEGIEI